MSWPIVGKMEPDYRHVTDKGNCQCQGLKEDAPLSALRLGLRSAPGTTLKVKITK